MFRWATQMAVDASTEAQLLPKLLRAYRWQLFLSTPRIYLDKSHPNIWLAEHLLQAFPNALFLGIERNPFATVASMLRHGGVSAWHRRWRDFPIPNRFLGITTDLANRYDELTLPQQCAYRWLAHHRRLNELRRTMTDRLCVIQYEHLANETKESMEQLQTFLKLPSPIAEPVVASDSLHKWKRQLTRNQIDEISSVVHSSSEQDLPAAA